MTAEVDIKGKLVHLISEYFGNATGTLYREAYANMPLEFVEKSSEKLLTEHLGLERARALIRSVKQQ